MKLHEIILECYNTDSSTWKAVRNRSSNSIWFDNGTALKVQINGIQDENDTDEEKTYTVRLFKFPQLENVTDGISTRISLTKNSIFASEVDIRPNSQLTDEISIDDYYTFTEDIFFQQSLVNNYGDISYNDLKMLIELREKFIELYQEKIHANS